MICGSAEYEQVADLCSRVAIIGDGRLSCVLEGNEVTKENILGRMPADLIETCAGRPSD